MRIAMDKAGRVVIPREVRERAHLRPGDPLEVRVRGGVVEIEPASVPMKLEKRGRWTVVVPLKKVPKLTQEEVDAVLDDIRSGNRD
jgi:AbrB family looped-hinge helix DNA binding protein